MTTASVHGQGACATTMLPCVYLNNGQKEARQDMLRVDTAAAAQTHVSMKVGFPFTSTIPSLKSVR